MRRWVRLVSSMRAFPGLGLATEVVDGSVPRHGGLARAAAAHLGRACGSSLDILATVKLDQLVEPLSGDTVLGEYVGGIGVAVDLSQVNATKPHRLLYPQNVGIKMPQFAEALPGTNPHCSA